MKDDLKELCKRIVITIIITLIVLGTYTLCFDKQDHYKVYCDKEYKVEYIQYSNYNEAGISIRLDNEGKVIPCK